jgi:hypothetical protein
VPTPAFIDADPRAFRFVLDFLRAQKDRVPPPTVPEAMVPCVIATAKRFGVTALGEMSTRTLSYEMVLQCYLNGKVRFNGMDLHGYSFRGWELYRPGVDKCSIRMVASFTNANVAGCDFSFANLENVCFNKADASGCDFSHAHFVDTYYYFRGADIRGCTFTLGEEVLLKVQKSAAQY